MARNATQLPQMQEMASPWQGAAYLANTIGDVVGQNRAASDIAATRDALAKARTGINYETGATDQQINEIAQYDPEQAEKLLQQRLERAREQRGYTQQEQLQQAGFTHADVGREDTQAFTAGQNELTRTAEAAKPLTDPAKLKADLDAGRIDQKTYDAAMTSATTPKTDPAFSKEQDLRKEYNMLPVIKNLPTIQGALERIQTGAKDTSAVGDMALIYGFMKMMDPESVVREGEYATAENARGVGDTVRNLYNKVTLGEKLTPEQRASFTAQAQSQYENYAAQVGEVNTRYEPIARQYGVDPIRVLVTPKSFAPEKPDVITVPDQSAVSGGPAAPATPAGKPVILDAGDTKGYMALPEGATYTVPGDPTVYTKKGKQVIE